MKTTLRKATPSSDKDSRLISAQEQINMLQREKQALESQLAKYSNHVQFDRREIPQSDYGARQPVEEKLQPACAIHGAQPSSNHKKSKSQVHDHYNLQHSKSHASRNKSALMRQTDDDAAYVQKSHKHSHHNHHHRHDTNSNSHVKISKHRYEELLEKERYTNQSNYSSSSSSHTSNSCHSSNSDISKNHSFDNSSIASNEDSYQDYSHQKNKKQYKVKKQAKKSHERYKKNYEESPKVSKHTSKSKIPNASQMITSASQLPQDKQSIQNMIEYLQKLVGQEHENPFNNSKLRESQNSMTAAQQQIQLQPQPQSPPTQTSYTPQNLYAVLGMSQQQNQLNNSLSNSSYYNNNNMRTQMSSLTLPENYGGNSYFYPSITTNPQYYLPQQHQNMNIKADAMCRLKTYEADINSLESKLMNLRSKIRGNHNNKSMSTTTTCGSTGNNSQFNNFMNSRNYNNNSNINMSYQPYTLQFSQLNQPYNTQLQQSQQFYNNSPLQNFSSMIQPLNQNNSLHQSHLCSSRAAPPCTNNTQHVCQSPQNHCCQIPVSTSRSASSPSCALHSNQDSQKQKQIAQPCQAHNNSQNSPASQNTCPTHQTVQMQAAPCATAASTASSNFIRNPIKTLNNDPLNQRKGSFSQQGIVVVSQQKQQQPVKPSQLSLNESQEQLHQHSAVFGMEADSLRANSNGSQRESKQRFQTEGDICQSGTNMYSPSDLRQQLFPGYQSDSADKRYQLSPGQPQVFCANQIPMQISVNPPPLTFCHHVPNQCCSNNTNSQCTCAHNNCDQVVEQTCTCCSVQEPPVNQEIPALIPSPESLKINLQTESDQSDELDEVINIQSPVKEEREEEDMNAVAGAAPERRKLNVVPDYMKVTQSRCNYVKNVRQDYLRRSFTPRNVSSPSSSTGNLTKRSADNINLQTPKAVAAAAAAAATSHQEPLNWDKVLTSFVQGGTSSASTTTGAADANSTLDLSKQQQQQELAVPGVPKNKSTFARSRTPNANNSMHSEDSKKALDSKQSNHNEKSINKSENKDNSDKILTTPVQIRTVDFMSHPPDFEQTLQVELDIFTKEIEAKKASLAASGLNTPIGSAKKQPNQVSSFSAAHVNQSEDSIAQPQQRKSSSNLNTVRTSQDKSLSQINIQNQSSEELSQLGATESELIDGKNSDNVAKNSLGVPIPKQLIDAKKKSSYQQIKQKRDEVQSMTPKSKPYQQSTQASFGRSSSLLINANNNNDDSRTQQQQQGSGQKSQFSQKYQKSQIAQVNNKQQQLRKSSMGSQGEMVDSLAK